MIGAGLVVLAGAAAFSLMGVSGTSKHHSDVSSQSRKGLLRYTPTAAEWASLTVQPVVERAFRAEHVTEGKIAVDEDRSTPVFSPYAGRVTKLLARPGDKVTQGQSLFIIEAADNVQAQNDFITASTALNKATSQLELAQIQDKRAHDLYEGKAAPLKDYQQSQATLTSAQNDMRSATTALEADCCFSGEGQHQSRNDSLLADRRNGGAAQGRSGTIRQCRCERPRVRRRRSVHGLVDGVCA